MKHILLSVVLVIGLSGCDFFSKSHPKMAEVWPVYSVPAQPKLDIPATIVPNKNPELDGMIRNVYTLTQYIETLRIIIDTHNVAARAHNQQVNQALGVSEVK